MAEYMNPHELAVYYLGAEWIGTQSTSANGKATVDLCRKKIDDLYSTEVVRGPVAREEFDRKYAEMFATKG